MVFGYLEDTQMAFKVFFKRLKAVKVRIKAIKNNEERRRMIWSSISYGIHVVERGDNADGVVLAQREQVEGTESWLFGASDQHMNSGITKHLQTQLFNKNITEYQIRRKAKEVMKEAYLSTKAKMHEEEEENDIRGSTTALLMNGESFVAAAFGWYRAVVCRNGVAAQIGTKKLREQKRSGMFRMACSFSNKNNRHNKRPRLYITAQKVEYETDFIILASDGVWEVMRNQEAVDLIHHIEDAQKAAECLAEEALRRMSKSTISCIVIRLH